MTDDPSRPVEVDVLVVSYGTREATLECIEAVQRSRDVRLRVTVVDNASPDGSADAIATRFPLVRLIRNEVNVGFGRANNQAYRLSSAPYVLLLNPDCYVRPDTIAACVSFLEQRTEASAAACLLRHADGSVQRSCRAFPTLRDEALRVLLPFQVARHLPFLGGYHLGGWGHDDTRMVDQPAGAYLLMRRDAWGDGAPFDERFFMYYEDVDLCRRLWEAGPIWFLASTEAVHLGEHSARRVRTPMAVALATSRHQYFEKWHGRRIARIVSGLGVAASALRAGAWRVAQLLGRHDEAADRALAHRSAARAALSLMRR